MWYPDLALEHLADAVTSIEMPMGTIANHTTTSLRHKSKRPTPRCKPLNYMIRPMYPWLTARSAFYHNIAIQADFRTCIRL
jgi:hypothetical protein